MMSDLPMVACSLLFTMELRAAEAGVGSEVRVLLVFTVGLLIGVLFSVSGMGLVPVLPVLPVVPVVLGVPVGFGFFHIVFGPFVGESGSRSRFLGKLRRLAQVVLGGVRPDTSIFQAKWLPHFGGTRVAVWRAFAARRHLSRRKTATTRRPKSSYRSGISYIG